MIYILLILFFNGSENTDREGFIVWNEGTGIDWTDFQGIPDSASPFDAQANSGLKYSYSYSINNKKLNVEFEIHSFFNSQLSWSKSQKQTHFLLDHEQLHFDISELHARKLKKTLSAFNFSKNVEKEVEKIFAKINSDRLQMQNKYDLESDHSKNNGLQAKWSAFIQEELHNLDSYK
jgi:hypothetical protein